MRGHNGQKLAEDGELDCFKIKICKCVKLLMSICGTILDFSLFRFRKK